MRSLCVWGVASGSAASHPDPGSSGMVEFSEESRHSGAFLSPPASSLLDYWPLTTGHCSRATPHAAIRWDQRGQVVRRPSAAGYCLPPTAQLPKNERARSRRASPLFQYVTEPGDFYGQNNLFLHNAVCVGSGGIARTLECKSAHSIHPYGSLLLSSVRDACSHEQLDASTERWHDLDFGVNP